MRSTAMVRARLIPVFVLLACAAHARAADAGVPADLLRRLAAQVAEAVKAGEKPKAWVDVLGRKSEVPLGGADEKFVTVLVQGNAFPLAWAKMRPEDIVSVARGSAGQHGERLLTAGEVAIALGLGEQASDLLAKAREADPKLAERIAALANKLPSAPPPPAVPQPAAAAKPANEPKESASASALPPVKLEPGWWKNIQVAVPKVFASHPRIYLREKPWGENGLTLDALRARAAKDPWKGWIPRFTGDPDNLAMKFLLTGDKAAADKAVAAIQSKPSQAGDTDDGDTLEQYCMAFDWLYAAYPGFTDEAKKKAADTIAGVAEDLVKRLTSGGPHIFHTRMYAWANGIVFAGLALNGHHPKADEFVQFGYKYWREKLFPARWHQAGAWQNGFGYGRKYMFRSTCAFLHAWQSGTGEDLWKVIKNEQDDWIGAQLRFLVTVQRPDGTYPTFGDCYNSDDEKFSGGLAQMLAAGTRDPLAAWLAQTLHKRHGLRTVEDHWNIYPFLFFDPAQAAKGPESLPTSAVWGPRALGFAVLRQGWGPKDAYVFFKCGDYFENHGHYDQGHFEIFREKPLAVDSGAYVGGFDSPWRLEYCRQSVASNTLLINDPADAGETGCQRVVNFQGADSLETYLNHKSCEMGDILDFRTGKDFTALVAEYASAYDTAKVKQCTRMLVFLAGKHLIVCDAVQTAKPMRVRFLLHYAADPSVEKNRAAIENGPSRLTCDTLLPENAKIAKLPGFTLNGKSYSPGKPMSEDAGKGQLEIEGADLSANTVLLNVLTVGPKEMPAPKATAKNTGSEIVVEIEGRKIHFSLTARTIAVK
ncbi:MAG: heparinase II/III family protein [Planctomycetota bacterium]|nr:heparinase II/III family protein [Planctomycetota bacterium]